MPFYSVPCSFTLPLWPCGWVGGLGGAAGCPCPDWTSVILYLSHSQDYPDLTVGYSPHSRYLAVRPSQEDGRCPADQDTPVYRYAVVSFGRYLVVGRYQLPYVVPYVTLPALPLWFRWRDAHLGSSSPGGCHTPQHLTPPTYPHLQLPRTMVTIPIHTHASYLVNPPAQPGHRYSQPCSQHTPAPPACGGIAGAAFPVPVLKGVFHSWMSGSFPPGLDYWRLVNFVKKMNDVLAHYDLLNR